MPKKGDESFLEYKKRVIDPVSDSFCAAKWLNATIWLGSGTTASCHHPPSHKISAKEVEQNPRALHNTMHKKLMRAQMLRGERPTECDYCWRIEDMKRDNVSDRIFKTVIYGDEEIQQIASLPASEDVDLKTLEIAFDRTCNFACSYCNASFSSTWANDIRKSGPYQNLVSDGAKAFQQDGGWSQPFKKDEVNPYIEAFWRWWPDLSKSLTELRVTGGEPLLSLDVWKLFEFFRENGSESIRFAINSNLGAPDEFINRLIEQSQHIKNFDLYTSCEAMGDQAEYIRDGLEFDRFKRNIEKICREGNIRELHMMMTINSLSLFSITEFLDQILDWKREFGRGFPSCSVNILRFPSFMSPLALPEHIKKDRHQHLSAWLEKNRDEPLLREFEIDGLQRLIDYIDVVKTPHRRTSSLESQWRDFRSFYQQYDMRRGKSLEKTFPPLLTDWVKSLPETNLRKFQGLVDGDATKGWHDDEALKKLAEKEGWVLDPEDSNPD